MQGEAVSTLFPSEASEPFGCAFAFQAHLMGGGTVVTAHGFRRRLDLQLQHTVKGTGNSRFSQ